MVKKTVYKLSGKLWIYPGEAANWHFLTLEKAAAEQIRTTYGTSRRGFGAIKVAVTVGDTTWQTSIFPDKISRSYLLPIKASVRKAEDVWAGDVVYYQLEIL